MIAEDKMIRDRANTVQNFLRFRTVSDNVPQANQDIGFQIGPRINASGRMDSAARAVETLLAEAAAAAAAGPKPVMAAPTHMRERRAKTSMSGVKIAALAAILLAFGALGAVDDWKKLTHPASGGITEKQKLFGQVGIDMLAGPSELAATAGNATATIRAVSRAYRIFMEISWRSVPVDGRGHR